MPFRLHDARHRADQQISSGARSSAPRRLVAGLAVATAAVGLMFVAAGANMATSSNAQSVAVAQSPVVAMALPRERQDLEYSQAVTRSRDVNAIGTRIRAISVARSLQREQLSLRDRATLAHTWRLPLQNPVPTSGFGYRWGNLHAGEDFAVSIGTPLASMSTGTVAYAGPESGFGNLVQIRYWDGTISYYGHMSMVSVYVGQRVGPGQIVGLSGNTGYSTGPHLHLEIHPNGGQPIDPLPWLTDHHIAF